ncbi:hypothetical protein JTE90_002713 [Oedothorax gibbosus]|uniref:Uncharacterized protein n=1 Tax=Oedothorax gibbosus TaxID=931172 RepID=A0AAV6VWS0_9ARAC|nr:hypothetical protein JTE90_002713 [Oedothorax gibbosus]
MVGLDSLSISYSGDPIGWTDRFGFTPESLSVSHEFVIEYPSLGKLEDAVVGKVVSKSTWCVMNVCVV